MNITIKKHLFLHVVIISLILCPAKSLSQFAGGSGTEEDPFQLETVEQLQEIKNYTNDHFIQIDDIDATVTMDWNNGKGFEPIGDQDFQFRGTYDGSGYKINNLTINRPDEHRVGLFGFSISAKLVSVRLENVNITGNYYVGTVAGRIAIGVVTNSFSSGKVSGEFAVGGIIGKATNSTIIESSFTSIEVYSNVKAGGVVGMLEHSSVSNSHSNGDVSGSTEVGGLIGSNDGGFISNSNSSSKVQSEYNKSPNRAAGGFIGTHGGGEITNCYATGTVTSDGGSSTGGFVGENYGVISDSYADGEVFGGNVRSGGFVGTVSDGKIFNSFSTGSVTGEGDYYGGFVGIMNSGEIIDSYSSGNVVTSGSTIGGFSGGIGRATVQNSVALGDVNGHQFTGGFVGGLFSSGEILNSKAFGNVNGTGFSIGGFAGRNASGMIAESISTGEVRGEQDDVGGFVGFNNRDIYNSSATGNVYGNDNHVGGFAGLNLNRIIRSYSDNEVTGSGENIGGLIGYSGGTVSESYALGKVQNGEMNVGGLIGSLDGEVIDSYSLATVHGEMNVGGLVGKNYEIGSITTSYSAGEVNGSHQTGGLVGLNEGNTENNYWNVELSGIAEAVGSGNLGGVTGLTDSEMRSMSVVDHMDALKFHETWISYEGELPTHLWSVSHFKIDEIAFNTPIGIGQTLKVNFKIKNIGGIADTQYVRLKNEAGDVIDEIYSLDLNGEESKSMALQWETGVTDEGSYEFTLHTEKDEKSIRFSVRSAPAKVVLRSPEDHELVERIPLFAWEPAELTETYQLQLSKSMEFDQLLYNFENISFEMFKPADSLDASEKYYWRVRSISDFGTGDWSDKRSFTTEMVTSNDFEELPEQYSLYQNYPNPFNPITTITYSLPKSGLTSLRVFNLLGHEVANLVDNELKSAGSHDVLFDASNLSSGTYLYKFSANDYTEIRKLTLIK